MRAYALLEIKKSPISKKGSFATQNIRKGTRICMMRGERLTLEKMIARVAKGEEAGSDPLGIGDEIYLDLEERARLINHSCNPNAYIRKKNELVAMRNIMKGEEITYDYSTTMNDNKKKINAAGMRLWTCKCHCGSRNCRGIIHQFRTLPRRRQLFYLRNKYAPDFILKAFPIKK